MAKYALIEMVYRSTKNCNIIYYDDYDSANAKAKECCEDNNCDAIVVEVLQEWSLFKEAKGKKP